MAGNNTFGAGQWAYDQSSQFHLMQRCDCPRSHPSQDQCEFCSRYPAATLYPAAATQLTINDNGFAQHGLGATRSGDDAMDWDPYPSQTSKMRQTIEQPQASAWGGGSEIAAGSSHADYWTMAGQNGQGFAFVGMQASFAIDPALQMKDLEVAEMFSFGVQDSSHTGLLDFPISHDMEDTVFAAQPNIGHGQIPVVYPDPDRLLASEPTIMQSPKLLKQHSTFGIINPESRAREPRPVTSLINQALPEVSQCSPPSDQPPTLSATSSSRRSRQEMFDPRLPHACETCGCRFPRQEDVRKHMRTHTDKKNRPHGCPVCAERFIHPREVERHINSVHLKKRLAYCPYPGCPSGVEGVSRVDNCRRHMRKCQFGPAGLEKSQQRSRQKS